MSPASVTTTTAVNSQVVYPSNPTARDFNGDTVDYCGTPLSLSDPLTCAELGSGWKGYQEMSLLCTVRGVTCPKWDTTYERGDLAPASKPRPYGASDQPGDGFIRTHGTSLAVAPCIPQIGNARWNGPKFVYDSPGATEWRLELDTRQSYLLLGEGHAGWGVDIMTADGKVAASAVPTQPTLPTNKWRHVDVSFDGSRLERGQTYYVSIKVAVLHGETAGSWGDVDFDNIKLTTNSVPQGDDDPLTDCEANPGDSITEGIEQLLLGLPGTDLDDGHDHEHGDTSGGTFCGLTEGVGNMAEPALDPLIKLANEPVISGMLDRGEGAFFVVDTTVQQTVAWMIGGPALPSSDPRELLAWVHDGSLGNGPDYVVVFAIYNVENTLGHVLEDPIGAVTGIVQGQVGNLQQVLSNPAGELLDLDPAFVLRSIQEFTKIILGELANPTPQSQSLGGRAWLDSDGDGVREDGEAPAAGVKTRLLDCDDSQVLAETTTGGDGRYDFANLQPTTAPEGYCVEFDLGHLPVGTVFSPFQSAAGTSANDSDVDPATEVGTPPRARTRLVIIEVDEHEATIDAGIRAGAGNGTTDGAGGRVWTDTDVDGVREAGEGGAAGVGVRLLGCDDSSVVDQTVTNAAGNFRFLGVAPGDYCVEVDLAGQGPGVTFTRARAAAATAATDSDVDPATITGEPATGRTFPVTVTAGAYVDTVGAGLAPHTHSDLTRSIGGVVWRDSNGDGQRTGGEPRLANVTVRLVRQSDGTVVATRKTGLMGGYSFGGFDSDWYRVEFDTVGLDAGASFSVSADAGSSSEFNCDVDPGTVTGPPARGRTRPILIRPGDNLQSIGAGVRF